MECSVRTKSASGEFTNCPNEAKHTWSKGINVCVEHHEAMTEQPKIDIDKRREEYAKRMESQSRNTGLPYGYQKAF